MLKTKIGVTLGALGASTYFLGLFGGYIPLAIVVGYILLAEQNIWLRRTALKAVILMFSFSILTYLIGVIPDTVGLIDDFAGLFGGNVPTGVVSQYTNLLISILSYAKIIIFLVLGIKALKQTSIQIAPIDNAVEKYIDQAPVQQ